MSACFALVSVEHRRARPEMRRSHPLANARGRDSSVAVATASSSACRSPFSSVSCAAARRAASWRNGSPTASWARRQRDQLQGREQPLRLELQPRQHRRKSRQRNQWLSQPSGLLQQIPGCWEPPSTSSTNSSQGAAPATSSPERTGRSQPAALAAGQGCRSRTQPTRAATSTCVTRSSSRPVRRARVRLRQRPQRRHVQVIGTETA